MTEQHNRIIIYGPKNDGTYVVEFGTSAGEAKRYCMTGCKNFDDFGISIFSDLAWC